MVSMLTIWERAWGLPADSDSDSDSESPRVRGVHFDSCFVQLSFSVIVRLNTGAAEVLSRSAQK